MSVPAETRELVRQRADYRCEFCGIHETDAGGELTLDHYRPRARGGSDDPHNLIYACNRCKHDYWPESSEAPRLWNPREEPFASHFARFFDGTLGSRSPTGAFTLRQLRLNRPQLVVGRQRDQQTAELRKQLGLYRGINAVLGQLLAQQSEVADQQKELLEDLRALLAQRLDSRS